MKLTHVDRRTKRVVAGLAAVVVVAACWCWATDAPGWPAFRLDSTAPFHVEFGRGSGWHGLDTISVEQDGAVVLHRLRKERVENTARDYWETASLRLSQDAVAEVVAAVNDTSVLGLGRSYHSGANDGTQWVLWVRQGTSQKAVYCDNRFPRAIERFSERLDRILEGNGLATVTWKRVPEAEERNHERELWDSTK